MTNNSGMAAELFISTAKRKNLEFWLPPKSKEEYLKDLQSCKNAKSKPKILDALIHIYRSSTIKNGGRYSPANLDELLGLFSKYMGDSSLAEVAAFLLVREGSYCEGIRDFAGALKFYARSLCYRVKDNDLRYFRLNNLGFCLNYLGRFKEAEPILREAIAIDPSHYNSHKNLGVCLEQSEKFEEAARSFLKSSELSMEDGRAAMHLKRLLKRHPELRNMPELAKFVGSQRADGQNGRQPPFKKTDPSAEEI